jgi:hypothetical protein
MKVIRNSSLPPTIHFHEQFETGIAADRKQLQLPVQVFPRQRQ